MMPAMLPDEIACYTAHLCQSRKVVEYGSGGSTVLALSFGVQLLSIESDAAWMNEKVRPIDTVQQAERDGRATFVHVDIGPTREWGQPVDDRSKHTWPNYPVAPWRHWDTADLVLVDGRFRVACTLESILRATPETRIVIHDFWNRTEYHAVLPFLDWQQSVETLGVFRRRPEIDRRRVEDLLGDYRYRTN